MELSVTQQSVGGVPVLAVRGEVDVYSAPALRDRLSELLTTDNKVVIVDLGDVGFLDSTGLGALVAARTAATEAGGRLPVVCDRERILKLFRITGLDTVFEIYPSVDEAADGLHKDAPTS
ncbi:MAG: anti-sigma factor antagonist [Pseudonocardiales bacterium]|nr:anti-sigma factor antagonist [Pseudonocardiales bacterium]